MRSPKKAVYGKSDEYPLQTRWELAGRSERFAASLTARANAYWQHHIRQHHRQRH
jgi:hypothetical protein